MTISEKKLTPKQIENLPLLPLTKLHSFRGSLRKVTLTFNGAGRTLQQFKAESDINTIMGQYMRTGVLPTLNDPNTGRYIDATGYEYQAAMELVASANSMFHNLPSALRARFKNDPAEFLEFAENPDNASKLAELGVKAHSDAQSQSGTPTPTLPPKSPENPLPASPEGISGKDSQPPKAV
ncbi:MAG: internal scaffolding protein [Microvirus sp.]|nr:MAG: internal scaffolding protein [Microvirus sp.]